MQLSLRQLTASVSARCPRADQWLLALAGGCLGLFTNSFPYQLMAGVDILFGGVWVMAVALALGPSFGLVASFAAYSGTLLLWGHPYAILSMAVEAFVVGLLVRRSRENVLPDLLFWVALLSSLPVLSTMLWLPLDPVQRWAILLKGPMCALLNVSGAVLLLTAANLAHWAGVADHVRALTSVRMLLKSVILVATISPLMIIAVEQGRFQQQARNREVDRATRIESAKLVADVEQFLATSRSAIASLAAEIEHQDLYQAGSAAQLLGRQHAIYPDFRTLIATDAAGRIIAASPPFTQQGKNLADTRQLVSQRDYFLKPRETLTPYISSVFAGAGFGSDPIVAISAPMVDRDGSFAGVVEGSLDLERLARSAELVEKQMQMKVVVLDAADNVVWASKDLAFRAMQSLATHPWKVAAGGVHSGAVVRLTGPKSGTTGGSWVVAHAQSGGNRWQVLMALPAAVVHGTLEGYYRQMTLFSLSAAVLCILLALFISRIITSPLESIVRQLQTLSIQEPATLSFQLSRNAPLEMRTLGRDIEMISAGLASSYDGLQDSLEERLRLNRELTRLLAELKSRALELSDAKLRAEDASRAKSAFLANLSHEIRTPLNAILGMLMMVEDTCTDDEQRRPLQSAIEAADRLQLMLSDMLHFSEADASQIEVERLAFYPSAILDAVLAVHRKPLQEKSLHVSSFVDTQAKRRFWGDPAKIKQVLWQLMENAVKFTHRGSIRVAIIVHPGEADSLQVRFEVSDTGVGISKQAQEDLFEPFTQADMSSTRKHGGTGLGLAICRKTVHRLGGTLGVQSEPGLGSVFWFQVPLTPELLGQPPPPALPGHSPTAGDSAKGRILVVDDNKVNQKVAGRLVESAGYQVDLASDGARAVDLASRNHYSLILMDCQMPVMDGFAATASIRALPGSIANVPIVAVTANVLDGDRDRCLASGMNDYLPKPLSKAELWRILGCWAGRTHSSPGATLGAPVLLPAEQRSGEPGETIDARR